MSKLLSADFSRLWKSKVFWFSVAAMFIISIVNILNSARVYQSLAADGFFKPLEYFYFQFAPYIAAIMGLFISLFLGTEHSDGTLRNKLIVGHSRTNVFLANFIVCLVGCLAITAAWLIGGLPGLFLIAPFEMGFSGFAVYCLIAIGFTAAFTAIFVWVATSSTNKALTVVFTIILFAVMVMIGSAVYERLSEPEFNSGMAFVDGEFVDLGETPNPLYISGVFRIVLEWLRDLMPMSQAINMALAPIEHPVRVIIGSIFTSVIITALGVISFRKKSLK